MNGGCLKVVWWFPEVVRIMFERCLKVFARCLVGSLKSQDWSITRKCFKTHIYFCFVFFGHNFFLPQNFLDTKFCWAQNLFGPKIFLASPPQTFLILRDLEIYWLTDLDLQNLKMKTTSRTRTVSNMKMILKMWTTLTMEMINKLMTT